MHNGFHHFLPLIKVVEKHKYTYNLDLEMSGGLYTWSNNQENPTLEKLDRILVSKNWEDIFPNVLVKKLPREISDHNPLIISS